MTNKKQELEQRLNREFEICDRHILRIEEALDELTDLLPMSVEDYVGLNSEQIRCLDDYTGKKMTFFHDPDGLPLELHE